MKNWWIWLVGLAGLIGLLVMGVCQPMINIRLVGEIDTSVKKFSMLILDQTQSVWQTMQDLVETNNHFVALLIGFFSIVVPLIKGALCAFIIWSKEQNKHKKIIDWLEILGKWSMADVFVVGIFIAYLSTKNQWRQVQDTLSVFGMKFPVDVKVNLASQLEPGFYWFTAYCLCSMVFVHLLKRSINRSS